MSRRTEQQPSPWVPRAALTAAFERAELAEACLRRVLNYINPELLTRHDFDWKSATEELCNE